MLLLLMRFDNLTIGLCTKTAGNIAAMTDDRGRGRGGAYDITPRKYLEAQSK